MNIRSARILLWRAFLSVSICVVCAGTLKAVLGPATPEIDAWFDEAGMVEVGRVTKVGTLPLEGPGGSLKEDIELGNLTCYKAPALCGSALSFRRNGSTGIDPIGPDLRKGDLVLVFLKKDEGVLTPVSGYAVLEVNWLQAPIRNSAPPPREGKDALQEDLATGLKSSSEATRLTALEYLRGFRTLTPPVATTLQRIPLNESLDLEERLSALATLLLSRPSRPEYVSMAASIARANPSDVGLEPRTASLVGHALGVLSNPADLPSLIEVFHSRAEAWHAGAMEAIRNLRDPSTVPVLIGALDDPDRDVEYQAVFTLCEITGKGGDYGPGIGQFERNPEPYVRLWKEWWQTEGRLKYQ